MSDAERFLIRAHGDDPGMTSRGFAGGRTPFGGSSYDALVDAIPDGAAAILDVACGDGFLLSLIRARAPRAQLFGIDMSDAELDHARRRPTLAGATLRCERAQQLSLADGAVDAIVSHLALMLMDDIEGVFAELARVLKPGGTLGLVVGSDVRVDHGAWRLFGNVFREVSEAEQASRVALGDPRTRTEAGLRELLGAAFESLELLELPVVLDGPVDDVWANVSSTYGMPCLSDDGRARVEERFRALAREIETPSGVIPFTLMLRLVSCRCG